MDMNVQLRRARQIVTLLAANMSVRAIANVLQADRRTVSNARRSIRTQHSNNTYYESSCTLETNGIDQWIAMYIDDDVARRIADLHHEALRGVHSSLMRRIYGL